MYEENVKWVCRREIMIINYVARKKISHGIEGLAKHIHL